MTATHPAPSRRSMGENLAALRSAQKPQAGTPLYSRLVNRPVGRYIAAWAASVGLTPNAISLISASFSFTAIALIALVKPSLLLAIAITVLLVVGYAFDSADGQVARLTGASSPLGEWLDHMIDCAKVASLHAALTWSVLRHSGLGEEWVLLPLGFGIVAGVMFFGMILTDQLRRQQGIPKAAAAPGRRDLLRAIAVLPTDYGLLCLSFLLFGAPAVFFGWYGLLLLANAALLAVAARSWVRQLSSVTKGS